MGEHKSRAELVDDLTKAADVVEIGGVYEHFRRTGRYRVLGFVISEATDGVEVRYSPVDEPRLEFTRPLDSWREQKESESGESVPRFQLVEAPADEFGGDEAHR